ncbi:MAG: SPOR domain-containing protein [Saprospiraceae bacterium]|nr:SPOR domain-containing protein [Saprospiraceae bacterium]
MKFYLSLLLALITGANLWASSPKLTEEAMPAPSEVYFIQVASYADPQFKDFKKIRSIGYVFEEKTSNGVSRIMMGAYTSKTYANQKLAQVRAKGFKDAFVSKRNIKEEDAIYIVQLATVNQTDDIYWANWESLAPSLCAQLSDKKIRVASGPYYTKSEADKVLEKIKSKGPKDIFVKRVSEKTIHKVTDFEKRASANYAKKTKIARTSIKALQQFLKTKTLYKDNVDGYWGPNTEKGVDVYKATDPTYNKYKMLASSTVYDNKVKDYSLQYYLNMIEKKPYTADEGLKEFKHPLAKVYRAYMYLNGDVPSQKAKVNKLMHEAIDMVFANYRGETRYDFSMKYAYEDLDQLIKHLRAVHEAVKDEPEVPCWLFKRHPRITAIAFAPYWNNSRDNYEVSSDCGTFMNMEEMRILMTISKDFASDPTAYKGNLAKVNQLYAMPQPMDNASAKKLEVWNGKLWDGLKQWSTGSPLQAKTYEALRFAYYDALRKLEDLYINRGFSALDARSLGLQVLKYSAGCSLDEYCGN